jgi:hypothetical protein
MKVDIAAESSLASRAQVPTGDPSEGNRMSGTLFSRLALATAVLAGAATVAPAAHADTSLPDVLGGSSVTIAVGHTLSQSIKLAPVPNSLNAYTVAAVCTATATPDASSTAVEVCTVNNVGVPSRVSLPGDVSAATTLVSVSRGTTATACVQSSAQFVESILGPGSITAPLRCYPVFLP